jgi:hypothetical protein
MDHFIKNILIYDYIANSTFERVFNLYKQHGDSSLFKIASPNIMIHWLKDNFLVIDKNKMQLSNEIKILFFFIEDMSKQKFKQLSDLNIDNILRNTVLPQISFDYITKENLAKYDAYRVNKYDKNINDVIFMEIALAISLFATSYDDNLKTLSQFITTISTNSIKIMSFISIGTFCYYARQYKNSNDNLYKIEKWMSRLTESLLDKSLIKYIDIDPNEFKKFLFMIMKYNVLETKSYSTPYERIYNIQSCFITDIKNTHAYMPGHTADQLLLITYDLFIHNDNWMALLTASAMMYSELVHVNLTMSWYYFMVNDIPVHNNFKIIGDKDEVEADIILMDEMTAIIKNSTHNPQ